MSPTTRQVNGDIPTSDHSSAFVQHLLGYPVISDGIHSFKANQYGQRSLQLGDSAYQTLAGPVAPLLARPYQLVSPYLSRADSLGDQALSRIDERFPAVRKPTGDLYNDTRALVLLPYRKGIEGRDHVFQVYADECSRAGDQKGLTHYPRAAISAAFILGNEGLSWINSFLTAKKAQASEVVNEKVNNANHN